MEFTKSEILPMPQKLQMTAFRSFEEEVTHGLDCNGRVKLK
jgi:hypothetical protein